MESLPLLQLESLQESRLDLLLSRLESLPEALSHRNHHPAPDLRHRLKVPTQPEADPVRPEVALIQLEMDLPILRTVPDPHQRADQHQNLEHRAPNGRKQSLSNSEALNYIVELHRGQLVFS